MPCPWFAAIVAAMASCRPSAGIRPAVPRPSPVPPEPPHPTARGQPPRGPFPAADGPLSSLEPNESPGVHSSERKKLHAKD
jgi:hypothetical protein